MTANRWWVKKIAWWLAAIDGVSEQIRMVSLAVTGFSTFSLLLQGFGVGQVAIATLGGVVTILGIVYTYLYNAGGVRNQVSRDRQDLSSNWAGPNSMIQSEMTARALIAALQAEQLTPTQRDALSEELGLTFEELSDGVSLDDFER